MTIYQETAKLVRKSKWEIKIGTMF